MSELAIYRGFVVLTVWEAVLAVWGSQVLGSGSPPWLCETTTCDWLLKLPGWVIAWPVLLCLPLCGCFLDPSWWPEATLANICCWWGCC